MSDLRLINADTVTAEKLYSLNELEQLARQWLEVPGDDDLPERLSLSNFLLWARKREREVGE